MTTRSIDQPNRQDAAQKPVVPVLSPVTSPGTSLVSSARPHPWEMVEHPIKTLRFVNDLRQDPHIALVRKLLYLLPMLLLLLAVLLPEGIIAALIAVALPVVGPAINLPTDAVIDWAFVGIAAYALLGIFPRALVAEHHAQVFHPGRIAKQQRLSQRPL
jgi:hypothetical protein